jgi:hypothetical protein
MTIKKEIRRVTQRTSILMQSTTSGEVDVFTLTDMGEFDIVGNFQTCPDWQSAVSLADKLALAVQANGRRDQ